MSRVQGNLKRLVFAVFICTAFVFSHAVVFAQEPTPDPLALPEELIRFYQIAEEFHRREHANFDYADYRVVYLVAPELPETVKNATAEAVAERFSAEIVHTWEEVEAILAESPIDIFFIHNSAIDEADAEWVRTAYRGGTMIVGFSTSFEALTELVDNRCVKNEAPLTPEIYDEWYLYPFYWSQATPATSKFIVDADVLENCSEKFEGLEGAASTHGAVFSGLGERLMLEDLGNWLKTHIINRKQQRLPMPSQANPVALTQEPTPVTIPSQEEIERADQMANEFFDREIANFDYADYRVVYLVAPELPETVKFATAEAVAERFSAQIVHSWEEVETILTESPIDIFFIHNSAIDEADAEWVRTAYRGGTMIVGFSVRFKKFAKLVGDACTKNPNPFVGDIYEEWYSYFSYWVSALPPEDKSIVDADMLENCSENFEGLTSLATTHGVSFLGLGDERWEGLIDKLMMHIILRKQQRLPMPSQAQAR